MYQNQPNGNGGMVSKLTTSPTLKVDIRVDSGQTDGKIGDITWHWKSSTGVLTVDAIRKVRCCSRRAMTRTAGNKGTAADGRHE